MKKSSPRNKYAEWKTFCISFLMSFTVLMFAVGMVVVDYNGRRMNYADDTPFFSVVEQQNGVQIANVNMFGVKKTADITKIVEIWENICDFCCIPYN